MWGHQSSSVPGRNQLLHCKVRKEKHRQPFGGVGCHQTPLFPGAPCPARPCTSWGSPAQEPNSCSPYHQQPPGSHPSAIADPRSLARRDQSGYQPSRIKKEPATPVEPLLCALLFELVLSQCTGSPSLPRILALLLGRGDCKAFIHIYHWGTQPAR